MYLFLQQGPANTTTYMIAGYAVIFIVMLVYMASLAIRRRNLNQDLAFCRSWKKRRNGLR